MVKGQDVYERNWCALQTAQLMLLQRQGQQRIESILARTSKDSHGNIIIKEGDKRVLESVLKRLAGRDRPDG